MANLGYTSIGPNTASGGRGYRLQRAQIPYDCRVLGMYIYAKYYWEYMEMRPGSYYFGQPLIGGIYAGTDYPTNLIANTEIGGESASGWRWYYRAFASPPQLMSGTYVYYGPWGELNPTHPQGGESYFRYTDTGGRSFWREGDWTKSPLTPASASDAATRQYSCYLVIEPLILPPYAPHTLPTAQNIDRAKTLAVTWTYTHPQNKPQTGYKVRRRPSGGAWTTTAWQNTATKSHTFAANIFSANTVYEWQVQVRDGDGEESPWSSSQNFTARSKPAAPTFTSPTANQIVVGASVVVTWNSIPGQQQIKCSTVTGGATTWTQTVTTTQSQRTFQLPPYDANGVQLKLEVMVNDLWSEEASRTINVQATDYPSMADVWAYGDNEGRRIRVRADFAAPGPGESAPVSISVYRDGMLIARGLPPNQSYYDYAVADGVDYEYSIRAYTADGGWREYEALDETTDG